MAEAVLKERVASKHVIFTRELLAASSVPADVHAASRKWKFSFFALPKATKFEHCQLCHALIVNLAVIRHESNDMVLTIGHDCLEKLRNLQETGRVESVTLPTWASHRDKMRRHIAGVFADAPQKLKRHIVSAMTKWLEAQSNLPENIKETLVWLQKFGATESQEKADELVAYYKSHRRFAVSEMLDEHSYNWVRFHRKARLIPKDITLNQLPKLLRLIERAKANQQKQRARELALWEADRPAREAESLLLRQKQAEALAASIAERNRTFDDRVERYVESGRLIRAKLSWKPNPKDPASGGWKVWQKEHLYILDNREEYSESDGEVLLKVVHKLKEKNVSFVVRVRVASDRNEEKLLEYRNYMHKNDQRGYRATFF